MRRKGIRITEINFVSAEVLFRNYPNHISELLRKRDYSIPQLRNENARTMNNKRGIIDLNTQNLFTTLPNQSLPAKFIAVLACPAALVSNATLFANLVC